MVQSVGRLSPSQHTASRKIAQIQFGFRVDGNSQRIDARVGSLIFSLQIGKDGVGLTNLLERFRLLHTPQFVPETIQDFPDRIRVGQFFVGPAFLLD